MKKLILFTVLLLANFSFSQDKLEYIDIDEIAVLAVESANNGDNDKALEYLNKINKNDSTYCSILTSKAYYFLESNKYDEAIITINNGLEHGCSSEDSSFYINLIVAYIGLEKYSKAIETSDEALKKYPNHYKFWYNKAVALEGLGEVNKAIQAYEQTIILNPYYVKPHLQLGNICFRQKKMAQALMCYNLYLLLQTDGEYASELIESLNNVASVTNSNKVNPDLIISPDDGAFEELDLILNQKLALREGYETENKIDLALVKQNHVLLNQLKGFKANNGFWDEKYIPFFNWITENNYFNDFIYTLFYSTENEDYKKIIKKNSDNISDFYNAYRIRWKEILALNKEEEEVDGIEKEITYYFNDSYVAAIGDFKDSKQKGEWKYYNENGSLKSKGSFDETGEKTGDWTWYHPNETIKETAFFESGKLQGANKQWHENGKLFVEANYSLDSLDGEYKSYNNKGALYQKKYYKKAKLDGPYESYFSVGKEIVEYQIPYKNSLIEGKALEYYSNGAVYMEMNFLKDKKNGVEKKYGKNKKLSSEVNTLDGNYHGAYKTYYSNGSTREEGTYVEGQFGGAIKRYYRDGALKGEFTYNKGKLDGLYTFYDYDGKLYYEYNYRNGNIISYKFFDKNGNIIKEDRKKGGEFYYYGLSSSGNITSEGLYDISGGKKGVWKFYSNNGIKYEEGKYTDNKAEGEHISFFKDGKKKSVSNYTNNDLNGYHASYYNNGQLKTQGYYKNGSAYGEWRRYYINGTLEETSYYHKDEYNGDQVSYDIGGKISNVYSYEYGDIVQSERYNVNGELFETIELELDANTYKILYKHYNGKPDIEIDYVNGIKHGQYLKYDFYGNKATTGNYLNGYKHGAWTWYHENGQVESAYNYVLGDSDGEAIDYYKNGQVENKSYYDYGKRTGKWLSYHENGELYTITEYDYDQKHGRKEFYSQSGKLQIIRFYFHNTLIGYSYLDEDSEELPMIKIENETGIVTAYFDNGKPSRVMEFYNGRLTNNYKAYFYSGQLENEMIYHNGDYDGNLIEYYEDGKVKKSVNYVFDNRQGVEKEFYEDGTIKKETLFLNDEIVDRKYYNTNGTLTKTEYYFDESIYSSKDY